MRHRPVQQQGDGPNGSASRNGAPRGAREPRCFPWSVRGLRAGRVFDRPVSRTVLVCIWGPRSQGRDSSTNSRCRAGGMRPRSLLYTRSSGLWQHLWCENCLNRAAQGSAAAAASGDPGDPPRAREDCRGFSEQIRKRSIYHERTSRSPDAGTREGFRKPLPPGLRSRVEAGSPAGKGARGGVSPELAVTGRPEPGLGDRSLPAAQSSGGRAATPSETPPVRCFL